MLAAKSLRCIRGFNSSECAPPQVLPERILFYRDGVSSGQFERVRVEETLGIYQAGSRFDVFDQEGRAVFEYAPNLTFVTVQKRHSARFIPGDPRDADRKTGNVKAGTVVDRGKLWVRSGRAVEKRGREKYSFVWFYLQLDVVHPWRFGLYPFFHGTHPRTSVSL